MHHRDQRTLAGCALDQDGSSIMGKNAGGAVAIPPCHQVCAPTLLGCARDLEDRGLAILAHGQQVGTMRDDRNAVARQAPALEVAVKHATRSRSRLQGHDKAPSSLKRAGTIAAAYSAATRPFQFLRPSSFSPSGVSFARS